MGRGKEKFDYLRVILEDWICKFTWIPETGRCMWVPNNVWTSPENFTFLHDCVKVLVPNNFHVYKDFFFKD